MKIAHAHSYPRLLTFTMMMNMPSHFFCYQCVSVFTLLFHTFESRLICWPLSTWKSEMFGHDDWPCEANFDAKMMQTQVPKLTAWFSFTSQSRHKKDKYCWPWEQNWCILGQSFKCVDSMPNGSYWDHVGRLAWIDPKLSKGGRERTLPPPVFLVLPCWLGDFKCNVWMFPWGCGLDQRTRKPSVEKAAASMKVHSFIPTALWHPKMYSGHRHSCLVAARNLHTQLGSK